MKSIVNNINFESIANIYQNKYFFCIEYFYIDEKVTFGIKIYNTKSTYNKKYKDFDFFIFQNNKFNFKNKEHKNESKFDPLLINEEYTSLKNKILSLKSSYQGKANETITLKRSYIIRPVCNPKTRIKVLKNKWTFKNIYNQYFCFCKGESCFSKRVIKESQRCKYNFYLSIIDNNRYLYNKTDYLFADFLDKELSSDDAYPIFKEMIKRNISAHYISGKRNIYKKYCKSNRQCQIIINEVNINGDFLEKYLELILRLKAVIAGSDLNTMDFIFYNIEYITSINLGHGVKFFKSFLYRNYTSPQKYNKLVLAPSKKLIAVALKYGWKEENIIKICLPKWDKYDTTKKGKRIYQSIFIFFTWRNLRENKKISSEYINNIFKLINSNILKKKLKKKYISLYYTLHPGIALYAKNLIINNLKSKYITLEKISDTLMKSNLLITDFSSVTFDFIYQRKPINIIMMMIIIILLIV
jgi:CDP-glycerol glycerophosphotransferase (TagB/SpsB family)